MASVGSMSVGLGFSTKANFPFSMYVYANINLVSIQYANIQTPYYPIRQ
jgi:hypothetical protein